MTTIGRNDRCPCGSRKKYKNCCLGKAEPATTEQGRLAHVRHTAENAIFDQIVDWTRRRFGRDWADPAMDAIAADLGPESDDVTVLLPWLVYLHPIQGAPPARHFLSERGGRLSEFERATLECNLASWLSQWEVRRVDPGVGVELLDLLTAETRFVHEVRGSRSLERWLVVMGSVVDYPEVSVLGGVHPRPLPPVESAAPLAEVRRALGVRTRRVPVARLRAPEAQVAMLQAWQHAVAEQALRALEPRIVHNTDGDLLVFCTDHFDFAPGNRAEVFARLAAVPGAHPEQPDSDDVVVFSRPGNPMHASWDNTIVGRASLKGDRLTAESNSIQRADSLRRLIEQATGPLVRHRARDVRDLGALLENPPGRPRKPVPAPVQAPEVQALVREFLERHYDTWPDSHLPALGGRTPREAVASPRLRTRLVALLKDMERLEGTKPEPERFDVSRLWRALGLDPLVPGVGRAPAPAAPVGPRTGAARRGKPTAAVEGTTRRPAARAVSAIHELRVTLRGSEPAIWRRVQVKSDMTLARLHGVLQTSMGWTNSHLHQFQAGATCYGERDAEFPERRSEKQALLGEVLREPNDTLVYQYDFGDGWEHDVVLERVLPPVPGCKYPYMTGGERACPPEDCGGLGGYEELLRVLADPADPEHEDLVEWVGGSFDPEEFDVAERNRAFHGGWYLPRDENAPRSATALPTLTPVGAGAKPRKK